MQCFLAFKNNNIYVKYCLAAVPDIIHDILWVKYYMVSYSVNSPQGRDEDAQCKNWQCCEDFDVEQIK